MTRLSLDLTNSLLAAVRSSVLVVIAMFLAGCSPSPSGTLDEQSTALESRVTFPAPKLPVKPTVASHDAADAPVIDGSKSRPVQWPAASDASDAVAVTEVTASQQLRWSAEYPQVTIHDLAWSPDGEMLAVGGMTHKGEKELFWAPTRLYSQDGTVAAELFTDSPNWPGGGESISDLEWSRDGKVLATAGGLTHSATLFYPSGEQQIELTDVATSVHAVRWCPDDRYVILVTGDRDLFLYDAEGNQIDVVGPAGSTVESVAWHPDGTMLACTDPLGVMLWGLRENARTDAPKDESANAVSLVPLVRVSLPLGEDQWPQTLDWNSEGSRLAVGAFGTGDVWLIDRDGTPLATMQGHTESVWRTLFSSKGILATTSSDATTRLWDQDGKPIAVLMSATPEEDILIDIAAWSPNGDHIAVASPDHLMRIYTSDAVPLANLRGHTGNIQAVSWHPNKECLATADDKKVTCIWNLPSQPQ